MIYISFNIKPSEEHFSNVDLEEASAIQKAFEGLLALAKKLNLKALCFHIKTLLLAKQEEHLRNL